MKRTVLILLLVALPVTSATADPVLPPGIIIRPEDRFDPAIQRLMADHSLRLLPLQRGQLYYLYPLEPGSRFEGVQIRYLEQLLDKQAAREALEEPDEPGEPADAPAPDKD